jgi:hypothetical protein
VVDPAGPLHWRSIEELAALVGLYGWLERRIFTMAGVWAARSTEETDTRRVDVCNAEARVWCAAVSRGHGMLAVRWAERLPVRAGVDAGALVAAPDGPLDAALDTLAEASDLPAPLTAFAEVLLPRLDAVYEAHLRTGSPVSEAPVLAVLAGAHWELVTEIERGRALVKAMPADRALSADLGEKLERAFAETHVFPAVWPS